MKEVDDYLDSYLDGRSDPGTAVMLVGHWGSGKTHYIRSYFDRAASAQVTTKLVAKPSILRWTTKVDPKAASDVGDPGRPVEHLYASFFGAENSAGISDQFLSQLYPRLNSKLGKVLGTAAIRLAGLGVQITGAGVLGEIAREEDGQAIRSWLSNPAGRVLVFDDLERSSMPIDRCLSIINSYVERDNLRVIVLANEQELIGDLLYRRWKEKVVGKTIQVLSNPLEVLEALVEELDAGPVRTAIERNTDDILGVMAASPSVNYRSIRSLVFDVQRIVSIVNERLGESHLAVLQLLKFSIAVGSEYRSGRIAGGDIRALQQALIIRAKDKEKRTERDKYLLELEERFSLVGALDSVVQGEDLIRYWQIGALNVDASNESILKHPAVVGEAYQPVWQRLWELRKLKAAGFKSARSDLIELLDRNQVIVQGELLHLVGVALALNDHGARLFPGSLDVKSWIAEYVRRPEVSDRLERSLYGEDGRESFAGLGYHKRDDPMFVEASKVIEFYVSAAEEKRLRSDVPKLLNEISELHYENIYAFDGRGSVGGRAWLHMVEVDEMVGIMLSDGALRPLLTNLLIRRYSEDGLGRLRVEWRWLRLLRDELLISSSKLAAPFKSISSEAIVDAAQRIRASLRHTIRVIKQRRHA